MTDLRTFEPDWVSPPGETIADLLEEKGWTQAELATRMGFTRKHVNELVAGKTALTPDAALKLEAVLGGSAGFWLNREAQFREARARLDAESRLVQDKAWLDELPLRDMLRMEWLPKKSAVGAQVAEALGYFGVASVSAWRTQYEAPLCAFRASTKAERSVGAIAAWLRRGETEAEAIRLGAYRDSQFRGALARLRSLTIETAPEKFVPILVDTCAQVGVAVVFVPTPKGCPVSGATRWRSATQAILQLSLRYRTNDHLWFTFFHEAGHLLLHGRRMFLEGADVIDEKCEREADTFAANTLIPEDQAAALEGLRKSQDAVTAFAARIGVAPGIVVGRMQKEGWLPWTHLNGLKVRYRWEPEAEQT